MNIGHLGVREYCLDTRASEQCCYNPKRCGARHGHFKHMVGVRRAQLFGHVCVEATILKICGRTLELSGHACIETSISNNFGKTFDLFGHVCVKAAISNSS